MTKISAKLKKLSLAIPVLAICASLLAPIMPASATDCDPDGGLNGGATCGKTTGSQSCLFGKVPTAWDANGKPTAYSDKNCIFTTIINTVLFLIGAICVVMIIYGGVRYTISGGESGAVTNAKNTILYAIIGLIIAVLAYAIVNFVLGRLTS